VQCDRATGHTGDHAEHDFDGIIMRHRWPQESAPPATEYVTREEIAGYMRQLANSTQVGCYALAIEFKGIADEMARRAGEVDRG